MNSQEKNKKNVRVEFHILQAFPVSCLNRDDVGAPKTAVVGGVTRARVSSQCWKRAVRMAMREYGVTLGTRTKLVGELVSKACKELGASDRQAAECGAGIEQIFIKKGDKKDSADDVEIDAEESSGSGAMDKTDTLMFLSPKEVSTLANAFKEKNFVVDDVIKKGKNSAKNLEKILGTFNECINAVDIALFGRMVAQAVSLNVEGAASFSHAISTHKVTNEVEFFTALDDCQSDPGASHMGSLEFNSATYYRYVGLNIGQLKKNLGDQHLSQALASFIKALYAAVPSARQATQAGYSRWSFARVLVRHGQPLQVPFETAVRSEDGGFLQPSKREMCTFLDKQEKLDGSLFQKIKGFEFGDDPNFNIDGLVEGIVAAVNEGIA